MTKLRLLVVLPLILAACSVAAPAFSETLTEVWRSPFGTAEAASVDPSDGSCWAGTGGSVMHLAADGTVLSQSDGFARAYSVCVNTADGSCWVADFIGDEVVHLDIDGSELCRLNGFWQPRSVSVDPNTGCCWVADSTNNEVVRISADGTQQWRYNGGSGFNNPVSVSVNPADGSCWVADDNNGEVVHLDSTGNLLQRVAGFDGPCAVSVDSGSGACWVGDDRGLMGTEVVRLLADYSEDFRIGGFFFSLHLCVDTTDGSCWVGNFGDVVHYDSFGAELLRDSGYGDPACVAPDPSDGSCWVADSSYARVVHIDSGGAELVSRDAFCHCLAVAANQADSSCWVADTNNDEVVHLASDGAELWRGGGFSRPQSVAVNPSDGSCWVADLNNGELVHLDAFGAELARIGGSWTPAAVSVNSADSSCWVADDSAGEVLHVLADHTVDRTFSGFSFPRSVSVDPTDGRCWAADTFNGEVVRLAPDGTQETMITGLGAIGSVCVDPSDGSCWVTHFPGGAAGSEELIHVSAAGVELLRIVVPGAEFVSVDPSDNSCWVTGSEDSIWRIVHLADDGTELSVWRSCWQPRCLSVDASDSSCWVADSGQSQVFRLATGAAQPWTVSYTHFEDGRIPWAVFSAGPDEAATWRRLINDPAAHSGVYAMSAEVSGEAVTGVWLELPTEAPGPDQVTLRAWFHIADRTVGDSSSFAGFVFSQDYPDATTGWGQALGWEVLSDTTSRYQLVGSSQAETAGLAEDEWHLVEVEYTRATNTLAVSVDGVLLSSVAAPGAGGQAPTYAILGSLGTGAAASSHVYFDDATVVLIGDVDHPTDPHLFGMVEGPELVAAGQQYSYTIHYGSGYPVLGTGPIVQELADEMLVGLTLPDGYQFIDSSLAPVSTATGHPVWEMLIPEPGQGGIIEVTLEVSAGPSTPPDDRLWLWVMEDPGGTPPDPPASLDWSAPPDATWGGPPDVLPQDVETDPKADLWVYKSGATFASPGDTITYRLLVGNCGLLPAAGYWVEDLLFGILDTPSLLSAWPPDLDPGETWETVVSYELPWYLSEGLVLHNAFYTPSSPAEANTDNNVAWWDTTVVTAHDPNCISVSPQGVVWSGDTLTYTIECENVGAGTAYGVHVVAQLDPALDDATLVLPRGVGYDPVGRMLFWPVGTLVSGAGDSFSFSVDVADNVARWHSIVGQAVVYFPSVPEETHTNIVVNPVSLLFPDVPPGHWAFDGVSAACAHRVVAGYPDGLYRPDRVVTRDQMAVYISRAMAGRAECVPPGPDTPTFPDVLSDHWAYKYVEYAAANGVVEGYPGGYYRPEYDVTRAQMAVFIARAIAEPTAGDDLVDYTPPAEPTFLDVPTDFWCYRHVEYLAENAVVLGYPDGLYRPAVAVTRDQMAVYVARAYGMLP